MYPTHSKSFWIFIFALLTAGADLLGATNISPNNEPVYSALFDFFMLILCGLLGICMISQAGTPFLSKYEVENSSKTLIKSWLIEVLISCLLIAINTYAWYISYQQAARYLPWVSNLTPLNAVLFSAKAALLEEIIFRLFIFSLLLFVLKNFFNSDKIKVILSLVISALLFSYLLHSGSFVSSIAGVILGYIYYSKGLVPAMAVHFIADCIPFVMVSFLL
ncbi:MAG: type II CAAX prenyl endopeptidase Rce1 family protein [Caulobacteraceae bacterium]